MLKNKRKKILLITFTLIGILSFLEYNGYIWHTSVFTLKYKIKGLDVSHHQEKIDWNKVPLKKYKFIFIKATEGSDMTDQKFKYNWTNARLAGFLVGAYHFFTTSSSGANQAKNFIQTVPRENKTLPPVIDIEINTSKNKNRVHKNLINLINALKKHYKKNPILYVTYETYNTFISGHFTDCHIWIRDIFKHPSLKDNRQWTFWQYCNRGRVSGINTYVDINTFYAEESELKKITDLNYNN